MWCRVVLVLTTRIEIEHFIDYPRDAVAILLHHFTDFLHLLVAEGDFRVGQYLCEALKGIERRANLMENFFNEF